MQSSPDCCRVNARIGECNPEIGKRIDETLFIFRTGWGGVYADADFDAIRLRRLCRMTARLVDVAAGLRQAAIKPSGLAVIQCSEARSVRFFEVIDISVGGEGTSGSDGSNEPDAPYDWAEQWLRGAGAH
jgi:hypothetical protein